nr:hypothetical protein [Tanacetum cinerariifolium]
MNNLDQNGPSGEDKEHEATTDTELPSTEDIQPLPVQEPPQNSNMHQIIKECCVEVPEQQKQKMKDTIALDSKLLSINSINSQRLEKKEKEVKNVEEQQAGRRNHAEKSLRNFRVIHKQPEHSLSMGYEHPSITPETESDEVTESNAENLLPIPSKCEVTLEDEIECDMPVKDVCSPVFITFSNPLFKDNDDLDSSDDESLLDEDVPAEEFKIYSNPLFDKDEINSDNLDPHCFNVESDFVESLLNRDTFIDFYSKFDFSGELAHIKPEIPKFNFDFEEEICLIENLLYDNSFPRLPEELNAEIADTIIESIPLLPISVQDGNSQQEEIDIVTETDDVLPPSVENDDDSSDDPLLGEADLFLSDNSIPPGIENVTDDPERDICFLEELLINNLILSHELSDSNFEDNPLNSRPPSKPPDDNFDLEPEVISAVMEDIDEPDEHFNPGGEIFVSSNNEDVDYFPFMFVIRIFLPYLILPEISPLFLSAESEDTIFDPVKQSNDVTRLQALVDKKKVVVTVATIRDVLHLDDAEGVDCLPNEEIFTALARMGYEKPSTKLTFYKAFFLSQWKFLIHTILQSMSAKRTSWNEFSSAMASAMICLSTGRKFNFSKYIFKSLVRNVDSSSKFCMYPRFIHLIIQNKLGDLSTHSTKYISPALTQKVFANMRRVGKGCSGVETPLFEGMLVAREPEEQGDAEEQGDTEEQGNADNAAEEPITAALEDDEALDIYVALTRRIKHLKHDKVAQNLEITKLKTRVKNMERANKIKTLKLRRLRKIETSQRIESSDDTIMEDVSNQGRMIDELDKDEGAVLMSKKEEKETEEVKDITGDAQVKGRQANIYQIDMDHAAKVLKVVAGVSETVSASAIVPADVNEIVSTTAVVPAATVTPALVKRYQTMKKRPQTEAQGRRNMMMYLKNTAGFRLDYFKGMSYDDIRPIFEAKFNSNIEFLLKSKEQMEEEENRAIASINDTSAQKAAKRRRLNEEAKDVEELKQHLNIMPDEDDDVYIEATPLARKVPVVD